MSIGVGDLVYKISAFDSSGAFLSRLTDRILRGIREGQRVQDSLNEGLVDVLGLDLSLPSCTAQPGDQVATRGGVEIVEGDRESNKEVCKDILRTLGLEDQVDVWRGKLEKYQGARTDLELLSENLDEAIRIKIGGVLQALIDDGCENVADGVKDLEGFVEVCWPKVRGLAESVLGADANPEQETMGVVTEALKKRSYQDVLHDLQVMVEREEVIQGKIQKLRFRVAGEYRGEMGALEMLERLEKFFGDAPEF